MAHYLSSPIHRKGPVVRGHFTPQEKWAGLSALNQYLTGSSSLDDLIERCASQVVEIFGFDYCRIVLRDEDGHYSSFVAWLDSGLGGGVRRGLESDQAEKVYNRLLDLPNNGPIYLTTKSFPVKDREIMGIADSNDFRVIPLRTEAEKIGILVLGFLSTSRPNFNFIQNRYVIDLLSDQLTGAIYRIQVNHRLENLSIETVLALSRTLESRDSNSAMHGRRIAYMSERVAESFGFAKQETRELYWAALLHDIGKIGVEDRILHKPEALDEEEWRIMKTHPDIGAHIVQGVSGLENIAPIIHHHHERMDGSGYPEGLTGENIPLGARILAVVDSYSAMTESRPYRIPRSHQEALAEIIRFAGELYDPVVVSRFTGIFDSSYHEEELSLSEFPKS